MLSSSSLGRERGNPLLSSPLDHLARFPDPQQQGSLGIRLCPADDDPVGYQGELQTSARAHFPPTVPSAITATATVSSLVVPPDTTSGPVGCDATQPTRHPDRALPDTSSADIEINTTTTIVPLSLAIRTITTTPFAPLPLGTNTLPPDHDLLVATLRRLILNARVLPPANDSTPLETHPPSHFDRSEGGNHPAKGSA